MTEDEAAGRTMQASAKKLWPASLALARGNWPLNCRPFPTVGWKLAAATKGALISPTNVKNCGYADDQTAFFLLVSRFVLLALLPLLCC